MTIKLTQKEAVVILQRYLSNSLNEHDVIIDLVNDTVKAPREELKTINICKLLACMEYKNWNGSQKIQVIKEIREYASTNGFHIGLADAKGFVESITGLISENIQRYQ